MPDNQMPEGARELISRVALLEDSEVAGIFLRNYENWPTRMGRDIDVLLPRTSIPTLLHRVSIETQNDSSQLLSINLWHDYIAFRFFFPKEDRILQLDIFYSKFSWLGFGFLLEADVLRDAVPHRNHVRIPCPAHEAALLLLGRLLGSLSIKREYRSKIEALLSDPIQRQKFESIIRSKFSHRAIENLNHIYDEENPRGVRSTGIRCRFNLAFLSFWRAPLSSSIELTRFLFCEFLRFLKPDGVMIAILGPDGAGKSSVIAEIFQNLAHVINGTKKFHWRPGIFPDFGALFGRREQISIESKCSDPHEKPPHGTCQSVIRLLYYLCDYWLGGLTTVRRHLAKNRFVVFDRYSFDIFIDPRRFRFRLPTWILMKFAYLAPPPDLVFCLDAPFEVLRSRKQEVSVKETIRQRDAYRSFVEKLPNGHIIDSSRPIEQVAGQIRDVIFEHMHSKTSRKLNELLNSSPFL